MMAMSGTRSMPAQQPAPAVDHAVENAGLKLEVSLLANLWRNSKAALADQEYRYERTIAELGMTVQKQAGIIKAQAKELQKRQAEDAAEESSAPPPSAPDAPPAPATA